MMQRLLTMFRRRHATESLSLEPVQKATIVLIEDDPEVVAAVRTAVSCGKTHLDLYVAGEPDIQHLSSRSPALILLNPEIGGPNAPLVRQLLTDQRLLPTPIVLLARNPAVAVSAADDFNLFDGQINQPIDEKTLLARIREFIDAPGQKQALRQADFKVPAIGASDHGAGAVDLLVTIEKHLPESQFSFTAQSALLQMAQVARHLEHRELAGYLERAECISNASTARARYCFRSVLRLCISMVTDQSDLIPGLAELRSGYLDNRSAETPDLDRLVEHRDFAALRNAGHNLKGSGGAYGFGDVTEIGRSLETAAKNSDAAGFRVQLDRMAVYISALRPAAAAKKEESHGTGIPVVGTVN
ncbi:MAG TPA: response regulator [Bryobacteraceae bacterium]|nr:response regulator [Bryobacteraceae bacterium]